METKFKHNDTVRVKNTNLIGELVDIIPIAIVNNNPIWKYKMWVRYTNRFVPVSEGEIEIHHD